MQPDQRALHLSDAERKTLVEIGRKLGKQALEDVAQIVKPDTILSWHRKLVGQKFDGSSLRKSLGRPRVDKELEDLVVRMAHENRSWGYNCIAGVLAHLGYAISYQTVGNILTQTPWYCASSRAPEDDDLERVYPHAHGGAVGHGLFHHRGVDDGWPGDVLCLIL
jgi:hypothetical protein